MLEKKKYFDDISEGMEIPSRNFGPITRQQLVDYASASGDYNPIHYDRSMAKMANLEGCIVHGMLSMAIVGSYITDWAKGGILKNYKSKFFGITPESCIITIKGKIIKKYEENNNNLVEIEVTSHLKNGTLTTQGSVIIAFNKKLNS